MLYRAALALIVCSFAAALGAATVTSIDRDPVSGALLGFDLQKRLQVKLPNADQPVSLPLDGVEEVIFGDQKALLPSAEQAPMKLTLRDGSILIGSPLATENPDSFRFRSASVGTLEINVSAIRRIEMRAHPKAELDQAPDEEELAGMIEENKAYFATGGPGICDILEVSDKGVKLFLPGITKDEAAAPVTAWDRIRSIVRKPAKLDEPTELFGIFSTDGGDVVRGVVSAWKEDTVTLATRLTSSVELKSKVLVSAIFKNGRFVYLSDLDPKTVEEYPYFRSPDFKPEDHLFTWRRDSAQGGGPLSIRGRRYSKGLGVHSVSSLTFRADRRYTKFSAAIGIDDSAHAMGSVVFKVLVDGKPRAFQVLTSAGGKTERVSKEDSGVLRKSDSVMRIEVDIAGATEVTLVVDAADDGDVGDRGNWANAKFVR